MNRPGQVVRITAVGVGLAYGLILYLTGIRIDADVRRGLAYLPTLATFLLLVWDLWAWRWPLIWRASSRPRIDGLWAVALLPTAESRIPKGGNRGPIPAYLIVKQTYWTTALRLFTAESSSISRSFFWDDVHGTGTGWLTFVYDNTPHATSPEAKSTSPRDLLAPAGKPPADRGGGHVLHRPLHQR